MTLKPQTSKLLLHSAQMNRVEAWLSRAESTHRPPVDQRVDSLLEAIRAGAGRHSSETWDEANERHAEEFIYDLRDAYPDRVHEITRPIQHPSHERLVARLLGEAPAGDKPPVCIVERQKLQPMARRTTNYNYIFTVPGRSRERLILIAHYDTWRGPGADDNTTGEEITKQYLLDDMRAPGPPELTHVYILAGSEECGLIGFTSQVLLAIGLALANMALTKGIWAVAVLGVAVVPLAKFRFGVSGSREYVKSLRAAEMECIKSVVSVDSVGEGKMYIPDSSLGADFVRAFVPFEGYAALNDVLEEAAHLHGIRYNNFIAGGTTDHVSFLEVNSTFRDRLGDWLGCPKWLGCHKHGKRKIPASAIVALNPGKASPLVFGGKIHTPNDTADRVYPGPLAEALRVLDYWYHLMHGGERIREPRDPDEYHYAQLYRVEVGQALLPVPSDRAPASVDNSTPTEYWLVLKDAIEPNRRNINGLYRVGAEITGDRAACGDMQILDWGVHTRLHHQAEDYARKIGARVERVPLRELAVHAPGGMLLFKRKVSPAARISAAWQTALGNFERLLGSNTFLAYFGGAYVIAQAVDAALNFSFRSSVAFAEFFFKYFWATLPLLVAAQLSIVLWLIGVRIPAMIDNNYKHLNKADNLLSLRRVAS